MPWSTRSTCWSSNGKDSRLLPWASARRSWSACWRARRCIVFNEHTDENGATVFEHVCGFGFEGIVLKRLTTPYRSGLPQHWIKVKNPDNNAGGTAYRGNGCNRSCAQYLRDVPIDTTSDHTWSAT
jgi:hypothetical protein